MTSPIPSEGSTVTNAYGPLRRRRGKTLNATSDDHLPARRQVIVAYDGNGSFT